MKGNAAKAAELMRKPPDLKHGGFCASIHAGMSFRPKNGHGLSYFESLPTRTTRRQLKSGQLVLFKLNMCITVLLDPGQSTENL